MPYPTRKRTARDERVVLNTLDDSWQTFEQIAARVGRLERQIVGWCLQSLKARGLALSRRSDDHGRVEYVIADLGR